MIARLKSSKAFFSADIRSSTQVSESKLKERENRALGATKLGAFVNLTLALLKGFTGTSVGSTALIADAVNNLGDLVTDGVVYLCISHARRKPTQERPWGSGKIEPLGALTVGSLVVFTGSAIGYTSLQTLYETYSAVVETTEVAQEVTSLTMHYAAAGVSLAAIASKEALFHYTLYAGQKSDSASVIANAWQHRADALISAAALLGFIGGQVGYEQLDPLAAVCLSVIIMRQGVGIVIDAVDDLRDSPTPPEETARLVATCLTVPGVAGVRELRARRSGPYIFVEGVLEVPHWSTASSAHRTATLAKEALLLLHSNRVAKVTMEVCPVGAAPASSTTASGSWIQEPSEVRTKIMGLLEGLAEIRAVDDVSVYYEGDSEVRTRVAVEVELAEESSGAGGVTGRAVDLVTQKVVQAVEQAYPGLFSVRVYVRSARAESVPVA